MFINTTQLIHATKNCTRTDSEVVKWQQKKNLKKTLSI